MTPEARRTLITRPIHIHYYGGHSFAGYCLTAHRDTAYARYLRAWRRQQQAQGDNAGYEEFLNNGTIMWNRP